MTTRRNFLAYAAAFLLLAIAFLSMPAALSAQTDRCLCDHYTFRLSETVRCNVTVAWATSPFGALNSHTLVPGEHFRVPCPLYEAYIITCTGPYRVLPINPLGAVCTPGLSVGGGCCVRACYVIDREGCQAIDLLPGDCTGADC